MQPGRSGCSFFAGEGGLCDTQIRLCINNQLHYLPLYLCSVSSQFQPLRRVSQSQSEVRAKLGSMVPACHLAGSHSAAATVVLLYSSNAWTLKSCSLQSTPCKQTSQCWPRTSICLRTYQRSTLVFVKQQPNAATAKSSQEHHFQDCGMSSRRRVVAVENEAFFSFRASSTTDECTVGKLGQCLGPARSNIEIG